MRRLVIFLAVSLIAIMLMGGLALAGGYTPVTTGADARDGLGGDSNDANWNVGGAPASPHGGFSTATNQCRVCHAVHAAGASSWRLLFGATNAETECDGCHGAAGQTSLKPYAWAQDVQGEHSLGSTTIPDANTAGLPGGGGLTCNSCHSVHGAGTMQLTYPAGVWNTRILRLDPQSGGAGGVFSASVVGAPAGTTNNELKTRFCSDCHDKNPAWDTSADTVDTRSANKTSHVQGPAAGGTVNVTGQGNTTVAWGANSAATGCTGCHSATTGGNGGLTTESAFPHRTLGSKLLDDNYGQGVANNALGINDAERVIPAMDEVCGSCHSQTGVLPGTTNGVGLSY